MSVAINDYTRVSDRSAELACQLPDGIGILPANFGSATNRRELLFTSEAATVKTLLRNGGIAVGNFLPEGERVGSIHNKHFDWAPIIFVSASLMSNNPALVSVALGIIANYATDFFRGLPDQKVKFRVVVEKKKDRSCKEIVYEGDAAGLKELSEIIRSISDE
jgi:hypothetical protein